MQPSCPRVFVYGTLQRGEERDTMWPCQPTKVEYATLRGRLYDLGQYPALLDGDDLIEGELWHFKERQMSLTLDALDEIECYGNDDVDLYIRRVVSVKTKCGQDLDAHTYFFANPDELAVVRVVQPNEHGICRWHRYFE